jgi:NAD+ synthetase
MPLNYEKAVENIRHELKKYIQKNNIKALVLGVSGGIDSTLCCALARPVCDELNVKLIGRSLPAGSNKDSEKSIADIVGSAFCTDYNIFNIEDSYKFINIRFMENSLFASGSDLHKIRQGNIKARLRMIYLYDLAQANGGLVLSTDNLTELNLGFWTLHGDVGDYAMIQHLWKTEVYEMASYLANIETNCDRKVGLELSIKAVPTDGLGISNSDLDQLGANTYEEVDIILKTWLTDDCDCFAWDEWLDYPGRVKNWEKFEEYRKTLENHPVVQRHIRTNFKRKNPIMIDRLTIENGNRFEGLEEREEIPEC